MSEALPKPSRLWMYVGIGLVIFWILCLAAFLPGPPNALDNTGISTPASYDWSPVDLKDQPVPFSRFKGKTVFLNFWATWCAPCVGEMPSIEKLARNPRLRDKDIAFVCVSSDASTDTVRQFVAGKNWPMTILRTDQVPPVFYSTATPVTFIIAPDGRIAAFVEGADDWSAPEVVDFLEKLAKPASPARSK